MKIKIRRKTFETNSSSMHSVCLLQKETGEIKTIEEAMDENKNLCIEDGKIIIKNASDLNFGWGLSVFADFYNKLCYAIATFCYGDKKEENLEKILEVVQKRFDVKEIVLPKEPYTNKNDYTGYIDHQSGGTIYEFRDDLENFLFNTKNYLIIDNDNSPHTYQIMRENLQTAEELLNFCNEKLDLTIADYILKKEDELKKHTGDER